MEVQLEFLYIDDAVEAYWKFQKRTNSIEPINIGTGVGLSIKTIAETIKK